MRGFGITYKAITVNSLPPFSECWRSPEDNPSGQWSPDSRHGHCYHPDICYRGNDWWKYFKNINCYLSLTQRTICFTWDIRSVLLGRTFLIKSVFCGCCWHDCCHCSQFWPLLYNKSYNNDSFAHVFLLLFRTVSKVSDVACGPLLITFTDI